jgi:hypothetical protein
VRGRGCGDLNDHVSCAPRLRASTSSAALAPDPSLAHTQCVQADCFTRKGLLPLPACCADLDWVGLSVTIPHKQAALQGASEVDPVAQQVGGAQLSTSGAAALHLHGLPATSSTAAAVAVSSHPCLCRSVAADWRGQHAGAASRWRAQRLQYGLVCRHHSHRARPAPR